MFIYLFGCTESWLRHVGSLVLVAACEITFPDEGLSPGPSHWEHSILAPCTTKEVPVLIFKLLLPWTR